MATLDAPAPGASVAPASSTGGPTAFVPYEGGAPQRDGAVLMVEAYAVAWCVIMAFVLLAHLRQRRLDRRITRLEGAMESVIRDRD